MARPSFRRVFSARDRGIVWNLDRAWNRYVRYPSLARRVASRAGFFHVEDHSYAHLALSLPAERVGVYVHDLIPFEPILNPALPRPVWHSWIFGRVWAGLRRARLLFRRHLAGGDLRDDVQPDLPVLQNRRVGGIEFLEVEVRLGRLAAVALDAVLLDKRHRVALKIRVSSGESARQGEIGRAHV